MRTDYGHLWKAIATACALFREVAPAVGERLGYRYNRGEDAGISAYLDRVKNDCASV